MDLPMASFFMIISIHNNPEQTVGVMFFNLDHVDNTVKKDEGN